MEEQELIVLRGTVPIITLIMLELVRRQNRKQSKHGTIGQVNRMNDLISRQAAIDALYDWSEHSMTDAEAWHIRQVIGDIKSMPSAQPEIVRCGQCKYAEVADKEDAQDGYTCQFHRGSIWFSGSYCSWAERRTDG